MSSISAILKVVFLSLKNNRNQRLKRKQKEQQKTAHCHNRPLTTALTHAEIRYQEQSATPVKQNTKSCCSRKKMKLNKIITSQGWLIFSQPTSPTIWSLQKPPVCHHAHGTPLSPNCSRCVQGDSFPMCFPTKSQLLQHLKFYYAAAFKASNQDHHTSDTLSHQ